MKAAILDDLGESPRVIEEDDGATKMYGNQDTANEMRFASFDPNTT